MGRRRAGELYGAIRMGIEAGRADATHYGEPTTGGMDQPNWVKVRSQYFIMDHDSSERFTRAYRRTLDRALNERISEMDDETRKEVRAGAERNRELRRSKDPDALRAKWRIETELAEVKTRLAALEHQRSESSDRA